MGPCMCGDLYCRSCGPCFGNHRCSTCGAWTMDGGCADPAACAEACRLAAEAEDKYLREMEAAEKEFNDRHAYAEFRDMWRGGGDCE